MTASASGPVVFAYDGSDLAKLAIDEAGELLGEGRDALLVCVWQTFDVGFAPVEGSEFDAANPEEVRHAAEQTAAEGCALAQKAGFTPQPIAIEASPAWEGVVKVADEHDASVIVLGSHGRRGIAEILVGSVAGAVVAHSKRTVLITHRRV
jgi:nucleotide-binding universal stress UspA family protein